MDTKMLTGQINTNATFCKIRKTCAKRGAGLPRRTIACSQKGRKISFLATRKKKEHAEPKLQQVLKIKRKLGHRQQVKKMKTRTSNQDVSDATTSRAPANGPQNANKPMKNQRNFLQNP